jgi:hypothetical protein
MPDFYQSGLDAAYNQQWSHAFMLTSYGWWYWGDADDDLYDNINQSRGEIESPEGYKGLSAKYYYQAANQDMGDWYLGCACHYIEDICLVLHATIPDYYMATKHVAFETWVENNLAAGWKLLAAVTADNSYYIVSDPRTAINQAAYYTSGYYSSVAGRKAWDAYWSQGRLRPNPASFSSHSARSRWRLSSPATVRSSQPASRARARAASDSPRPRAAAIALSIRDRLTAPSR